VENGGDISGLFADSAVANGVVFANTSNWPHGFQGGVPISGGLSAISGDGSQELWHFTTAAPNLSGVAVANGVVYFQSIDGNLYALDAKTGGRLAEVATGGQESGPAISHGHVYLGIGNAFALVADIQHPPPGAIMALGVPDQDDTDDQASTLPKFQNRSVTSFVTEGAVATLSGTIVDTNPVGPFVLRVDWGDNTPVEVITVPVNVVAAASALAQLNAALAGISGVLSVTHQYNETGTFDIHLSWGDDRGTSNTADMLVTVTPVSGKRK
jgi:outer membrane protein assembly factor BamB